MGYYIRSSFGKNRDPAPSKPSKSVKDMSTYEMIKRGYDAMGRMAKDIHDLYHPPGCKCAICQIRADDDDSDPDAYTGTYCSLPCFNCSVLTCPTHPDRKPASKPDAKVTYKVSKVAPPVSNLHTAVKTDDQGKKWVLVGEHEDRNRKDIAIQNLESQLKSLTESYQQVVAQRDSLMHDRGLRSAGMHVGGQPLYLVDPQWDPKQVDGGVHGVPFERRPVETDRQAMQRLAQVCQDEGIRARLTRQQRTAKLEAEERENPGGYMIEEFGEGAVRYVPPRKPKPQTVYVRPGEWRNA